ncbi:MAG: hypothetical protein PHE11_06685 [Candidatus Omnitrophica bacterium]|nr:hypothetical protein [Candidatus Omnitrophota bacterium]
MEQDDKTRETLESIVQNTNATLTTNENDEPFLILTSWQELAMIQRELNKQLNPETYYKWAITYYNEYGRDAFQEMRFGQDEHGNPTSTTKGYAPYEVPEGLIELDDIILNGFDDEYMTCSECGKAIKTTPSYFAGDKPRYAILDCDIFCGDCIATNHEEEYIDERINSAKNAINTSIISEDRLTELGWKKMKTRFESGLHERQNDKPKDVLEKFGKHRDVLFTYETGQFDINFWAWVKKHEDTRI